jgi:hypothetical protein
MMRPVRSPFVLWALLLCAACGGESSGPNGGGRPSVRIVSGGTGSDTISKILPEQLTLEVMDASGRPAAGRMVEFEVVPVKNEPPLTGEYQHVLLGGPGATAFAGQGGLATDANGRASFRVRLGEKAGLGVVRIRVPEIAPAGAFEARYTVLAGAGDHVVLTPVDSVAYVGSGYQVTGYLADRGGNKLASGPLAFTIAAGGATIDAAGSVVAGAVGRVRIVAQANGRFGTAWMSVPPRATVASLEPDGVFAPFGIFLIGLEGSARTPLSTGPANTFPSGQGFGWSPDGRDLVIARGDSIDLVSPSSAERRLVKFDGPLLLGARYSRDGGWIHFARPFTGLARMRSDGTGIEQIGAAARGDFRPSPSHDGLSVAYGTNNSPCGVQDCIRVRDIASGKDRLYAGARDWLVRGKNGAWSPVEDVVAYAWDAGRNDAELGLIRADGTGQRVLATDISAVNWMDFSPDGKWLLVASSFAPVTLFEVATGTRLPLATLPKSLATAWRP